MWDELVCPFDHAPLVAREEWLACRGCGRGYPLVDSVPTFLSDAQPPVQLAPAKRGDKAPLVRAARGGHQIAELLTQFRSSKPPRVLLNAATAPALVQAKCPAAGYCVDQQASRLAEQRGGAPRLRFVAADYRELPFARGAFELALLCDLPEMRADAPRVLREVHRCLVATGTLWLAQDATLTGRAILEAALEAGFQLDRSGTLDDESHDAPRNVLPMWPSADARYFVLRPTRRSVRGVELRLVA